MAGLVGYASSDEEDEVPEEEPAKASKTPSHSDSEPLHTNGAAAASAAQDNHVHDATQPQPTPDPSSALDSAPLGPAPAPAGSAASQVDAYAVTSDNEEAHSVNGNPPTSPYTANRAMIRSLTLPPVLDLDMPPSPPGSPGPGLTAKFEKFLELKRTKGIHFNASIAQSSAFKNPAQMDKLLGFAGITTTFGEEGGSNNHRAVEQYATTLPMELWDPSGFPASAYRGALRKAQEKLAKEKARAPGEPVQFVAASSATALVPSDNDSEPQVPQKIPASASATAKRPKSKFDQV